MGHLAPFLFAVLLVLPTTSHATGHDALAGPAPLAGPDTGRPPVADWSGAYFGATAGLSGYGRFRAPFCRNLPPFLLQCDSGDVKPGAQAPEPTGSLFGVTAGYDWQMGNVVVGIAGDLLLGELFDNAPSSGGDNCGAGGCELSVSSVAMLRGRLGYAVSDRFLPYATFGVAFSEVTVDFPTFPPSADDMATNAVVGLGGEFMVSDRVSVAMDYLHLVERAEYLGAGSGGSLIFGVTNFSGDILRLNVLFQFQKRPQERECQARRVATAERSCGDCIGHSVSAAIATIAPCASHILMPVSESCQWQ